MKYKNKLASESSPYLLQHANNPVNWYPWGNEALEKARTENKLLIISIGYAACHWCHVMEHESFEDVSVAQVMNDFFVSIKVDREERPDIDQIYMDAAYLITGRGGWPLNVIALPDGRPVFAGTYFRKNEWTRILLYFKDLFQKEPETFDQEAGKLTKAINEIGIPGAGENGYIFTKEDLDEAVKK
ncbi:MAG: thioredoxin domain-containing protein [Ignavibacteriaceae bacterium]|nr:thioredoxin domain-containing protein [Ignavibacteriaceae bacterium]